MIGYVRGILEGKYNEAVILDNNGMGFCVRTPGTTVDRLPAVGSEVKFYTYLYLREDSISLFGFLTKEELDIFQLLLTVSGVGPKGALGILSTLSCRELRMAVHGQDSKAIAKAPGIGAKTAQRVIIDLKDRLSLEEAWEIDETNPIVVEGIGAVQKEAIEALTALGYGMAQAAAAVGKVEISEEMTVEQCLKLSLKHML